MCPLLQIIFEGYKNVTSSAIVLDGVRVVEGDQGAPCPVLPANAGTGATFTTTTSSPAASSTTSTRRAVSTGSQSPAASSGPRQLPAPTVVTSHSTADPATNPATVGTLLLTNTNQSLHSTTSPSTVDPATDRATGGTLHLTSVYI